MILVADASFAAKVLLKEEGTELAQHWWTDHAVTWWAPALIAAEVEAAIAMHHRNHPDVFDDSRRKVASATWAAMLDGIALHAVDRVLTERAVGIIQDYGPVRGADACYVAVAAMLTGETGVEALLGSFDGQQRRAATAAGIALTPA